MTRNHTLPEIGFIRLKDLLPPHGPIPMSSSSIWAKCKEGTFPSPVRLSNRVTAWRVEDIRAFIANPNGEAK